VALFVVLVLLMLCTLAVVGACRSMLLNEALVGNAADYARAFAAAEALLRDAEIDVLGVLPDGGACRPSDPQPGCRDAAGIGFPYAAGELQRLADSLGADPSQPCRDGICFAESAALLPDEFFDRPEQNAAAAARYGQFTGASAEGLRQNPYLARNAWYWVEVFDYPVAAGILEAASPVQSDASRPYVFRITAVVLGNRPETRAMLREVFIPSPMTGS